MGNAIHPLNNWGRLTSEPLDAFLSRGELHQVAVDKWPVVSDDIRQKMARMAAAAAWGLGNNSFVSTVKATNFLVQFLVQQSV